MHIHIHVYAYTDIEQCSHYFNSLRPTVSALLTLRTWACNAVGFLKVASLHFTKFVATLKSRPKLNELQNLGHGARTGLHDKFQRRHRAV